MEAESNRILLSTFWLYLYCNVLPFFFSEWEQQILTWEVVVLRWDFLSRDKSINGTFRVFAFRQPHKLPPFTHCQYLTQIFLHSSAWHFSRWSSEILPQPLLTCLGLFPLLPFILDASLNVKAGFPTTTPSTKPCPKKLSTPFSYRDAGGRWHILDSGYNFVSYTLQLCEFNVITD